MHKVMRNTMVVAMGPSAITDVITQILLELEGGGLGGGTEAGMSAALAESRTLNSTQESQLTDLRATLCASAAAAQQVDSIDKQLVSQLLVKYFEGSRKSEPLGVLASMLGCSEGQRRTGHIRILHFKRRSLGVSAPH